MSVAVGFYETFAHTGEVREAQKNVIDIQNRLMEAQQHRILTMAELTIAQKEQQLIQDELASCTRSQDRFIGLVRRKIDVSFFCVCRENVTYIKIIIMITI